MKARTLLQWLLLVQAGAVAGIAWGAVRWFALPWPPALLAGLLAVLGARLLISINNFVLSARASSVTPDEFRLHPAGMLRLFAEEFIASMHTSSWSMVRARPVQRIHAGSTAPPVLLLHGYGCNSGYWAHLVPMLDAARISHASLDLEPIMGSIDDYVPLIAGAVDALRRASGADKVVVVAHSMGGLAARAYLRGHGTAHVARVITLGTPHQGTSLASFGVGANARQMRRQAGEGEAAMNAWLQALAASETAEKRDIVTSLYTHHDNIVAPQTSSWLQGARNIAFGGIGHVAMGRNRYILSCVMHEIAALSPGP